MTHVMDVASPGRKAVADEPQYCTQILRNLFDYLALRFAIRTDKIGYDRK